MKNENFCYAPFVHMFLESNGGDSYQKLCCQSTGNLPAEDNILKNLDNHWTSEYYQDVRKRMLANEKLNECNSCNRKTEHNEWSDRDSYNELWSERGIKVDIKNIVILVA